MKTQECEVSLTNSGGVFNVSRYFVLPRSRWGIKGIYHECDLLALSKSGTLHEIEIKISKSDLLADKRKMHAHTSEIIKRLWFAVPSGLVEYAKDKIPEDAGLISCGVTKSGRFVSTVIKIPRHRGKEKPDQSVIAHMYELMAMRYWSERSRIITAISRKNNIPA